MSGLADLTDLDQAKPADRLEMVARWLGVVAWKPSSLAALTSHRDDPARLLTLALVSPEYLVA